MSAVVRSDKGHDTSEASLRRRERKKVSNRLSQRLGRQKTKQRIAELESALQAFSKSDAHGALRDKVKENQALREENMQLRRRLQHIGQLCVGVDMTSGLEGVLDRDQDPGQDRDTMWSPNVTRNPAGEEASTTQDCAAQAERQSPNRSIMIAHNPETSVDDLVALGDIVERDLQIFTRDSERFEEPLQQSMPSAIESLCDTGQAHASQSNVGELDFDTTVSMEQADDGIMPPTADVSLGRQCYSGESRRRDTGNNSRSLALLTAEGRRNREASSFALPLTLPYPTTSSICVFEEWLQITISFYSGYTKEQLHALLPSSPCLGAIFSLSSCSNKLSKELADIVRSRYPSTELTDLAAAYWCLHHLLRYYLIPSLEELDRLPSNMRPLATQSQFKLNWVHFLPWPHIRQALLQESGTLLNSEFERIVTTGVRLYWPYGLDEAFSVGSCDATGQVGSGPCGCNCASMSLTENFKSHISHPRNWCLKPMESQLVDKFPGLESIIR